MTDEKTGAQVIRALDMLEILSGRVVLGMSNKDLAAAMRCPAPSVTRTAAVLISKAVRPSSQPGSTAFAASVSAGTHSTA